MATHSEPSVQAYHLSRLQNKSLCPAIRCARRIAASTSITYAILPREIRKVNRKFLFFENKNGMESQCHITNYLIVT